MARLYVIQHPGGFTFLDQKYTKRRHTMILSKAIWRRFCKAVVNLDRVLMTRRSKKMVWHVTDRMHLLASKGHRQLSVIIKTEDPECFHIDHLSDWMHLVHQCRVSNMRDKWLAIRRRRERRHTNKYMSPTKKPDTNLIYLANDIDGLTL